MSEQDPGTPSGHAQQWAIGRAARQRIPRSALGTWHAGADREDPVAVLQAQEATRVADLVPIRYERMSASAFAFYRGAAAVMARDLGTRPHTDLTVQLCGDAHLANFGGFAAPDRTLVFDLNDFDETLPGPFEYDVMRLAASFDIAARHKGLSAKQQASTVGLMTREYRTAVQAFARMSRLEVWYSRLTGQDVIDGLLDVGEKRRATSLERTLVKGQQKTSSRAVSRYTRVGDDGRLRLISQPPLLVRAADVAVGYSEDEIQAFLARVMDGYLDSLNDDRRRLVSGYRVVDAARKVVGVGSVGTRCWIGLLVSETDDDDDLVLQYKQAGPSVLEAVLPPSQYAHHGRRVVEGQRLIQAASDVMLGWTTATSFTGSSNDFYVRQMWDWKTSPDIDAMDEVAFGVYARICGWTLARAHSRSGSPKAIAAYLGNGASFDKAMVEFAASYADQNEADYRALLAAIKAGRVQRSAPPAQAQPVDL